jgi:hypothetical protein
VAMFQKEREAVVEATAQLKDSSELLLAVAGVAVVIAVTALVISVATAARK